VPFAFGRRAVVALPLVSFVVPVTQPGFELAHRTHPVCLRLGFGPVLGLAETRGAKTVATFYLGLERLAANAARQS